MVREHGRRGRTGGTGLEQSVVRIFATRQEPDYELPWQTRPVSSSSGSGVIIGRGRVLTGAHVIANATFLQVQKVAEPTRYVGRVEAVCHDADLALVAVDDPTFMEGVTPARLGGLPELREPITVVGFPVGGEEVSVTEGVVSRVEVQRYSHSQYELLAVTVDAAINPGNSGGPAFQDGKVVGVAFQSLEEAENIGDLVPAPVVKAFLDAAETTPRVSLPALSVTTQSLENPQLRARVGMSPEQTGVLVSRLEFGGAAWGLLFPGDVLLSVDGHPIANNGTIRYHRRYRTRFSAVLTDHRVGDELALDVLRGGERLPLRIKLAPRQALVRHSEYDRLPTYYVYAGMVFQPLSRDLLETWDRWEDTAPVELLHAYHSGIRLDERREVVVLTEVLADEVNVSYEGYTYDSVVSVGGERPRDMRDFVRRMDAAAGQVEIRTSTDAVIVVDVAAAREANARILARYRVPGDRSPDLSA